MALRENTIVESVPAAAGDFTWRTACLIAVITAIGVGLRLFRLDLHGYWHDEVISTFVARAPAAEIFDSIAAADTHPPLYHILLHYWGMLFSYELVPLRLFSVAVSATCIPAVFMLGRAIASPAVGLAAATLMAASPFQIFHGQQARMYPLLTLVVLLALLALWGAWQKGGAWRWAWFGLVSAAGLYTHVYFAFTLLGLNLWALIEVVSSRRSDRRRFAALIVAQVGAVALFLPFLPTMIGLTGSVIADFWIRGATPLDWLFALMALLNYGTFLNNSGPLWRLLVLYVPATSAIVLGLLFAALALWRRPHERDRWSLLLLAVLTPCLVATTLSLTVRPILLDRSLIGVSGPFFVLLGWATVCAWGRPITRLTAGAVAVSMAVGLFLIYPAAPRPHSLQAAVDYIFAQRAPGEAVVLLDWQSFDLTALRHPDENDVYVGSAAEQIDYWQRRMALVRWHTPAQVGPAEGYAGAYSRVWVLQTPYTYPINWEAVAPWLAEQGSVVLERELGDGSVVVYALE